MLAALYLRVSTDGQTTENQRRELEAVAIAKGWEVVRAYEDAGISGAKGRDGRPGFDAMLNDAVRRRFDVVMTWSVDRLGRSLADLVSAMQTLKGAKVNLFLHQQALDTTTPAGEAMYGMLGVFAQFERSMIQARVKAGLARAREKGTKTGRAIGRPAVREAKEAEIRNLLAAGMGILKTAKLAGVGSGTVQRVRKEMLASARSGPPSKLTLS